MEDNDLVLTPGWTWHDHHNPTDGFPIWLDALDIGVAMALNQTFYEPFGEASQPVRERRGDFVQERVSWVQRLEIEPESRSCALSVDPDVGVVPVTCSGTFTLHDTEGDRCLRTFEGDLRIRVPIIGSRAEKSLAPGIVRRLDLEAEALDHYLAT